MPLKTVNLGHWKFICFVNRTQTIETDIYEYDYESNTDILMLVRKDSKIRLVSIKVNPWLEYGQAPDPERKEYDIQMFIFSGVIENNEEIRGDTIQSCQLLTRDIYSQSSFMLIIQFDDCLKKVALNASDEDSQNQLVCSSADMSRIKMVRGTNDKIYYGKTKGYSGILMEIMHHKSQVNEIVQTEVFQLPGEKILAFQIDDENVVDDGTEEAPQALFIMTDKQKIYHIKHDEGGNFQTERIIDLSVFDLTEVLAELDRVDWAQVFIAERQLTMKGKFYNYATDTVDILETPKKYFYQLTKQNKKGKVGQSESLKRLSTQLQE